MQFKQYPSYKDSGVEWLGEVPEHWIVCLFKRQIVRNDGGVWGEEPTGHNDTIVFRSTEQTMDGRWNIVNPALRNLSDKEKKSALLEEGDLLLTKSSGSSLHIGKTTLVDVEIAKNRCCYSNFMQRIRTTKTYNSTLGWYVLNNQLTREQFSVFSTSTTGLANLNSEIIGNIHIVVPPVNEQLKVIEYLDTETTRIDNLIAKQEKLIELLEEQRKSIISHAVTKGLDPNAPMKDSGVEWLGEVPENWVVLKNRHLLNFSTGLSITKANLQESGIPCVSYGEVHSKLGFEFNPEVDDVKFVSDEYLSTSRNCLLNQGDFVFADTSEDFEGSGNFSYLNSKTQAFAGYHTVIARLKSNQNPRFLAYVFDSNAHRKQIQTLVKGIKVFSITQTILKDVYSWIPPIVEQNEIVQYIDEKCKKIDELISKQNGLIENLKEYRSSIISHAVTGKIDVREYAE